MEVFKVNNNDLEAQVRMWKTESIQLQIERDRSANSITRFRLLIASLIRQLEVPRAIGLAYIAEDMRHILDQEDYLEVVRSGYEFEVFMKGEQS